MPEPGSKERCFHGLVRLDQVLPILDRLIRAGKLWPLWPVTALRRAFHEQAVLPLLETGFPAQSLEQIFSEVYRTSLWGAEAGRDYYSGWGSGGRFAESYVEFTARFIRERRITSVLDLGCGDFRIGSRIAARGVRYTGVDVVPGLIRLLDQRHGGGDIKFLIADITRDALPEAELCLLRQVFQHLSNAHILAALENTKHIRYTLVTEHVATRRGTIPNLDITSGPAARPALGSGVFLEKPPFRLPVVLIHHVPAGEGGELRTVLLERT